MWEDIRLRLQDPAAEYTKSFLIILSLNAHRDTHKHKEAALFTGIHMFAEL